jgi:hypothetical protein
LIAKFGPVALPAIATIQNPPRDCNLQPAAASLSWLEIDCSSESEWRVPRNHFFESLEDRQLFSFNGLDLAGRPSHQPAGSARNVLVGSVATKNLEYYQASEAQANRSFDDSINWGDGSDNSAMTFVAGKFGRTKIYANHAYAEPGVYPVKLEFLNAPDSTGLQAQFIQFIDRGTTSVTVAPSRFAVKPPVIHQTVSTPFAASITVSHDQETFVQDATARISWGDGSSPVVVNSTGPAFDSWIFAANHQFTRPGIFTVHFQMHFADGLAADDKPVYIENVVEQVSVTR